MSQNKAKGTTEAKSEALTVAGIFFGLPILLQVSDIAIEGEATPLAMGQLALIAAVSLTALLGVKVAAKLAPYVYILATFGVTIKAVIGVSPLYWLLMLAFSICAHETFVSDELKIFFAPKKVSSPKPAKS